MCGRTRTAQTAAQLEAEASQAVNCTVPWSEGTTWSGGGDNIAPGRQVPVLYFEANAGAYRLMPMHWGLVPSYTKLDEKRGPDFFRLFNARSETVGEVNVFGRLLERKRCAVFLEGFFEWHLDFKKEKQPYYVHRADGRPSKRFPSSRTYHYGRGDRERCTRRR